MVDPKKSLVFSLIAIILWSLIPSSILAAPRSQYFDFGPYYSQKGVLGFSFSSLENLPAPKLPENIIPTKATGILPGSPLYPFERLWENTQLLFTPDPVNREELWLKIASERLSEGKTLMDQGKTEAAVTALSDYSKTISSVAQNVSQASAAKVEEVITAQVILVQSLALSSPPNQAEKWSTALVGATQTLDQAAQIQGAPAIPEDLSAQIQQLKTDGLLSEEESNKIYGFKNRSQVREELEKLASSNQFPLSEVAKLDTAVANKYPEIYQQYTANLQVAELRSYQSLPQPPEEVLEEIKKWQSNQSVSPSNDIKPYLWYNRAQELAKEVDLSNFSQNQQSEVAKLYPQAVTDNPTYSPPSSPAPSPSPSPSPVPSEGTDQTVSPLSSPSPSPSPTAPAAKLYVGAESGSLPGDFNYNIKRWNEQLSLSFTFDPAEKARLRIQIAERRLAEATAIAAEPKKALFYEGVLKDYQQAMDDAADLLKTAADSPSAKQVARQLEAQAARHEVVLEKGLLPAPKDPQLISKAVQAAENAMDQSADTLDRPAIPAALAQRLGDLKTQGVLLAEEAEDLVNSASRTEVREKVRKLIEQDTFPLADAKKLDEAQILSSPTDYNQLVEVRKVEELQNLRAVQAEFAQTATLKLNVTNLDQKETALQSSIEPALITEEDLKGRDDLVETYNSLKDQPRPINGGQFGVDVKPGSSPAPASSPTAADAVLSTCPAGAIFKQFEGCVWADNGRSLNDYDQYKCDGPRQYYSFAAKKCVPYERGDGQKDDAQPICPLGYTWNWQNQSCATSSGGTIVLPTPKPESEPKTCPEGATYQEPYCIWDDNGKKIHDSDQYRCSGRGQYYNFGQRKCVEHPKVGEKYPDDANPACKKDFRWSWSDGQCVSVNVVPPPVYDAKNLSVPKPVITPDSPVYFVKQWGDAIALAVAVTGEAKEQTRISQAKERLAESLYALEKGDGELFDKTLASYTAKMQELYNDLAKANLSDGAKKNISERLSKEAVAQNLLLQKASVLAKPELDSSIAAAVSATILGVDKAADLAGESAIPDEIKAKIEALPKEMIGEEDKKALLETDSRVEARLSLGELVAKGGLTSQDTIFLSEDLDQTDSLTKAKLEELNKLEGIASAKDQKEKIIQQVEENEKIVQGLNEFERSFEAGGEIPAEIRPFVRLTRIDEVAQTIRPDVVRLDEWQNRKDVILAVATLQEEFRPTKQAIQQVQDFRRRNPGAGLPYDLARIEALSYSLGVRGEAGPCYLPTPPFPANTPCPAPGAAIPITSFIGPRPVDEEGYRPGYNAPSTDKDGKPLVYGQGPKSEGAGVCPGGYHWMYDSGGWCMSNGGNYNSSYNYTPSGTGPGYTPYSPYYTAPGVPPATYGYPGSGGSSYSYSPPSYWGPAPTFYTTNPPAGTVPGSGPKPTAPGQCPSGYHWMSDSGGWCMADGPTYTPASWQSGGLLPGASTSGTPPPGGYNCGSQSFNPATGKCNDGACPGGYNWDGSKCVVPSPNLNQGSCGPGYYWSNNSCFPNTSSGGGGSTPWCWSASPPPGGWSCGSGSSWDSSTCSCRPSGSVSYPSSGGYSPGSSYQYGCTPGNYWDGSKCVTGSYEGSGWSDTSARNQSWCQPPSGGCGSNSYWDYGSCYCRSSSTYTGGSGSSPSNQCQGLSCGGGAWLDYSTCSCKYSGTSSTGTSSSGAPITCYPPSAGCPGGWYDYGTCSCKTSSSNTSGSSGGTSGGSSSGSCSPGYHWMSDNGGWCMSDGGGSSSSPASTSTTSPSSTPAPTTTESAPAPAPATEPAPAPAPTTTESAPAPAPAPATEPAPAPAQ